MLAPNQITIIKINKVNIQHYKELGYECNLKDKIEIPIEHLTEGSHVNVNVICDICGKITQRAYQQYIKYHTDGYDCCAKCKTAKFETTNLKKYGCKNVSSLKETRDKVKNTFINKYGADNPMRVLKIKEKAKSTNLIKYGAENPFASEEVKEKIKETCLIKYGVESANSSEEVKEKIRQTNLKRYGFEYGLYSKEIKEKCIKSRLSNGSIPTSSQQIELHKMMQEQYPDAILNYHCGRCVFDIALLLDDKIKIDVEYDGGFWHRNQQKDIKRDMYFRSKGWKILRIKSGHKLPLIKELFEAINYLVNTEHHYKEIVLDDWTNKTA